MRQNRRASRPCRARKVRAVDGRQAAWRHAISLFAASAFLLGQLPGAGRVALAQGAMPSVIRDAEIEELLRDYTRPVLKAAGLTAQNVQIVILNDRAFNAFVADGRRIFVFVGALTDSTTPMGFMNFASAPTSGIPTIPKVAPRSLGRTPKAISSSSHALQSKNSKKRLLKTMPAGSQWPHSTVNWRR